MHRLLVILFFIKSVTSFAQQEGPGVGTTLRTLSGKDLITGAISDIEFSNSSTYTLLHFWSSRSDSCLKDLKDFVILANTYRQKATVFAFPYELKQDIARTKELILKYKMNWAQLLQYKQSNAEGANVIDVLKVDEFPTYMLLNKQGTILVRSGSLADVEDVLKRKEQ
jgi:hypothetical protein